MTNTINSEEVSDAGSYKDKGNEAFKASRWEEAVEHYGKAIKAGSKHKELAVFYKNRAAAYLKLGKYENAVEDCTESLKAAPGIPRHCSVGLRRTKLWRSSKRPTKTQPLCLKRIPATKPYSPCSRGFMSSWKSALPVMPRHPQKSSR